MAEILEHPWFKVGLPPEAERGDWNKQLVRGDIDHEMRSEQIKATVRAALQASYRKPPLFASYEPKRCMSDSLASDQAMSDIDASEGANY